MTITSLLALGLAATSVQPKIVSASMFKNGYAVVIREFDAPSPGEYTMQTIPQASLGTLWFSASGGATIDSLKTVTTSKPSEVDASDLSSILTANVGKELTLGLKNGDKVTGESVSGKLLSLSGEIAVLQTDTGTLVVLKSTITSIASSKGTLVYKLPSTSFERSLDFTVSGHGGKIHMVSLERGLTWVPGYSVDMSDKKNLVITAKATVLNDLEDLDGIEGKFVTGFPNVPFASFVDPLVSGQSVDAFTNFLNSAVISNSRMDARGMGGQNYAKAPAMDMGFSPAEGMAMSQAAGQQLEDLFFYNEPNLSLKRGDRAYYALFRAEAPYKEVYTWDVPDPVVNNLDYRQPTDTDEPEDVWHTLEFKNTSGRPFTTAVATTFKDSQVIGQDTMGYVSPGGDAELKITKALDERAESSEEEVSRERGAIKNLNGMPIYDLVVMKGTLQVKNQKPEDVTLRIRHNFTGELVTADGNPVAKKTAKGLKDINPTGLLTWIPTVAAGKSLTLTYTYKLYVRTQ